MDKISTSMLAKQLNIQGKELFKILEDNNLIKSIVNLRKNQWGLTVEGKKIGGEIVKSIKFGDYIVWPKDFNPLKIYGIVEIELISVTMLAEKFGIGARRMNHIISEIGWTEKSIKGWNITKLGENIGGREYEHSISGAAFTKWPISILDNTTLKNALGINGDTNNDDVVKKNNISEDLTFREKFPAKYRTKDGHNVRSRGELVIDNALYEYGLAHAYERKVPVEEDVYSDFYIPAQNGGRAVYIEYWGIENDKSYEDRKKIKKDIYEKYHMNLIELENKHIDNLDDYLPKFLLKYGIKTYEG